MIVFHSRLQKAHPVLFIDYGNLLHCDKNRQRPLWRRCFSIDRIRTFSLLPSGSLSFLLLSEDALCKIGYVAALQ